MKPKTLEQAGGPRIVRTALGLLPLQVLFRGGEAILPLLLAAWLGRNAQTNLYYLLATYFVFAAGLLTAAFQDSAVIPVLIEVASSRPAEFPGVVGFLLGHTLAAGGALALTLGSSAALVAYFVSPSPLIAVELIVVMAAHLVAVGVRAFYVGLLNARGIFHGHPVASGMGMGVTLLVLDLGRRALGVRIVPVGMLAGELTSCLLLMGFVRASLALRVRPNLTRPSAVVRIFALVRAEATGQLITRVNPFIDQITAGLAGIVGGGTLLRYAGDVASLPTSLVQATILPVFLTRVALEVKRPKEFITTTRRTLSAVFLLLAGLSAVCGLVRRPLCRLLFLHGQMDEAGIASMVAILPWALVGVAPFGALLVLSRAHVAQQNSRIMPQMGLLNSTLNAGLNVLLVHVMGLSGIALSTSLTYAVVALVFWVRLPHRSLRVGA